MKAYYPTYDKLWGKDKDKKADLKWNIYKSGIVADLTISQWGARTKLKPEDLGLKDVPELIKLGHKDLMKKEHLAKINTAINKAISYIYRNSFAFPFGTARFFPFTIVEEAIAFMKECEKEFNEGLEDLLKDYEVNRQVVLSEYKDIFNQMLSETHHWTEKRVENLINKLRSRYPTEKELRHKFNFDFVIFEITIPDFKMISSDEAVDKAKENAELSMAYKKRINGFVEDAAARLKSMLLTTTKDLSKRLTTGTLSKKSANSFAKFAESFNKLNFIGIDFEETMKEFNEQLKDFDKSKLSDEQYKRELQNGIDKMSKKAEGLDNNLIIQSYMRRITRPEASESDQWSE